VVQVRLNLPRVENVWQPVRVRHRLKVANEPTTKWALRLLAKLLAGRYRSPSAAPDQKATAQQQGVPIYRRYRHSKRVQPHSSKCSSGD
jgi:hypothetical protein